VTHDQLERAALTSPSTQGRSAQFKRLYGLQDYLHVGGPHMSARQAAERLGVTKRTVERWRRALREAS
jgi:transposase